MSRKKALAIFSQLPFPHIDGNRQKVFRHISILSKHFDLEVVIVADEEANIETINFLKDNCITYKVFHFPKWRFILNLFKCMYSDIPLQVAYFYFKEVQEYVTIKSKENDLVFCNLIRTVKYVENVKKPKYFDMVDSISINYKNSKDSVKSLFWKIIYSIEHKRLHNYEIKSFSFFNQTFLVNYNEFKYWDSVIKKNVTWLPNGVKQELFTYNKKDEKYKNSVAFIGRVDYQPNQDAVFWFIKECIPYMDSRIDFIIIGLNPPKKLLKFASKHQNVKFLGFVDDPYVVLNSSLAIVSPMQTGAGMQNKVMEGMALGKVNITTTLAAKPIIGAKNKEHILTEDDGHKMAIIINSLFIDNNKFQKVGNNARNLIESTFTWDNFEKTLISKISP